MNEYYSLTKVEDYEDDAGYIQSEYTTIIGRGDKSQITKFLRNVPNTAYMYFVTIWQDESYEDDSIIEQINGDEWVDEHKLIYDATNAVDELMIDYMHGGGGDDDYMYILYPDDPEYIINRCYKGKSLNEIFTQMRNCGWDIINAI